MISSFWDYPFDGDSSSEENGNLVEARVYMSIRGNGKTGNYLERVTSASKYRDCKEDYIQYKMDNQMETDVHIMQGVGTNKPGIHISHGDTLVPLWMLQSLMTLSTSELGKCVSIVWYCHAGFSAECMLYNRNLVPLGKWLVVWSLGLGALGFRVFGFKGSKGCR